VRIAVEGPARIAGVGNGNPQSFEPFQADYVDLFYGKAMLILGAGHQSGTARVTARAEGLPSATVTVRIE
jgi:beta-galactosidase